MPRPLREKHYNVYFPSVSEPVRFIYSAIHDNKGPNTKLSVKRNMTYLGLRGSL